MSFDAAAEFDRQAATLRAAGHPISGLPALRGAVLAAAHAAPTPGRLPFLLVVPAPALQTMPLTRLRGPGQVSKHLSDLDRFAPLPELAVPAEPYVLVNVERGEDFCGRVPTEALAEIVARGRTPLTIEEGVALITHFPASLEKNKCFSLAGSRCGDKRVPALWISRNAPMLGWCWAGNPHSWLGMASAGSRIGVAHVTGR